MADTSEKTLVSHGKIYLTGSILRRCVSFIMLPIYTRCLTPSDYGIIELLTMVLDFVGIIIGLRVGQSIFRFYARYEHQKDKNEVITTAIYLVVFANTVGFFFLYLAGNYIAMAVFDDTVQKNYLFLFSLTLLMQGFIEIPMTYLRARRRPWHYVTFSITKLFIQLSMNIIFVVWLDMHVEGVIYSAIITSAVVGAMLAYYIVKDCGISFSIAKARHLVSFSFPLMLTSMITFYITFGDRYFLKHYMGLEEVGVYSLAYKFGFLLVFLVGSPFSAVWDIEKYEIAKKYNSQVVFKKVLINYSAIVVFVCIVISLFIKDVLQVMAAPSFWKAADIVPVILAAYVANIWGYYSNLGVFIKYRTIETTYGNLLAAIVITIGYYVLIPRFGGMGAAWATVLAFSTRWCWGYFRGKRLYDMGISWRYPFLLTVLWISVYGISKIGWEFPMGVRVAWNTMLLAVAAGAYLFTPLLPYDVRSTLRRFVKHPKMLFDIR